MLLLLSSVKAVLSEEGDERRADAALARVAPGGLEGHLPAEILGVPLALGGEKDAAALEVPACCGHVEGRPAVGSAAIWVGSDLKEPREEHPLCSSRATGFRAA